MERFIYYINIIITIGVEVMESIIQSFIKIFENKISNIPDGSYMLVPRELVRIRKKRNGKVKIKLKNGEIFEGIVNILNPRLIVFIANNKGHLFYIIREKGNSHLVIIRDDMARVLSLYRSLIKVIRRKLERREKIRITRVKLEGDGYIYYTRRKKSILTLAPQRYYVQISGEMHTLEVQYPSKDSILISANTMNKLFLSKLTRFFQKAY